MREVRIAHWKYVCVPLLLALVILFGAARSSSAATLTVCASGCAYADLQDALNAAQPGDTILLRAGETYVGNFILPAKSNTGGAYIVIRSDAPSSAVPPAGTRLVPPGRPGANVAASALARLRGAGGSLRTTPVLRTASGAHHYRLQFLEIDGTAQEGWETLISLGYVGSQTTLASVPYSIVLDRVYIHGHATKGQKRCLALNGRDLEVLDSHISGCASFRADAQAIAGFNGPGPFRIVNNYLEGSGENIMFGGADPKITNLVPSDIEIRRNHIAKPVRWRDPILRAVSGAPSLTAASGAGTLAAGTHYFKVVAVMDSQGGIAVSAPSPERAVSTGSGAGVRMSWSAVAGADRYRVYRGTQAGGQNRYLETPGAVTSFTYTGSGEQSGTPPAGGTRWIVKNLLELKNAQRVIVDGNLLEYSFKGSEIGTAILLTPRNQGGTAPWTVVRDVTVSNNIIRHTGNGFTILGRDYNHTSQRAERLTIRNNLLYDISNSWGPYSRFLKITQGPAYLTVDHNTVFQQGTVLLIEDGASPGFRFTNNVMPHNQYGIFGTGAGTGAAALEAYFPSAVFARNALGGGDASKYPAGNFFPGMATFLAQFVNAGADDYRLVSSSVFKGAGTDGKDLGADFAALSAAQGGSGGGDPAPPPSGPYGGTPAAVPGTIQAEHFDDGAAGVAYFDTTSGNAGRTYRSTDVDLAAASDTGGGYTVGWMAVGEWLNYTVDVAAAGTYDVEFRVASPSGGGTLHLEANGVNKTGALTIPYTGGWQTWTTLRKTGVSLSAGRQVFRVKIDSAGANGATANLNFVRVAAGSSSTPPPPSGGGDIVLHAADVTRIAGNWSRTSYTSGAGGQAMVSADRGWSSTSAPLAAPANYFEAQFTPEANRAYHVWVRLRGAGNSKWNESVWMQFSGAVTSAGAAVWRIGTASALLVNLENCSGCGISAWGWQDGAYWLNQAAIVRFPSSSPQTLRVQTREDGVIVDQIVLSPATYFTTRPGALKNDTTILTRTPDGGTGTTPSAADVVLYARDVSRMAGNWARRSSTSGAGGELLHSDDRGWSASSAPIASPAHYFEMTFTPEANRAYRLWLRLRGSADSKWNESVWVQFSGSVNASGGPIWRTGTTDALLVNLENCYGCGVAGWGWQDNAYWVGESSVVRFATATPQTIRVQTREDGVEIDQIVLSPLTYFDAAPGPVTRDTTIVPR